MKRFVCSFSIFCLLIIGASAQSTTFEFVSDTYHVTSEIGEDHARALSEELEALIVLYNEDFHFSLEELEPRLRVRVFATKAQYDSYLDRLLGEQRDGFVYLHYADLAKSELVGYVSDDPDLRTSMVHQSFIQFFRAFIPNPPLWLREGFAVYFEASQYDADFGRAVYRENLAWLDALKQMVAGGLGAGMITLDDILSIDIASARDQIDMFYPQAWGMVSYLINSEDKAINRILWDALSALEPTASLSQNVSAVQREALRWVNQQRLLDGFIAYITDRRSFRGWIEHGIDLYNTADYPEAESAFGQALSLNEGNFIPHYYLGLIAYEQGNFGLADFQYQSALELGADEAITLYALGVNAYADNRFEDAVAYLEQTVDVDPAYTERAEDLLIRIRG